MSGLVKFFTKKKSSKEGNKENDASLKRVNFERASTRSEVGADAQHRERDREAMRAIPNPYSVWTEPKKTRGPSSCPGVALDSTYFNERRSVRPPKQERRAGSVYGDVGGRDISGLRQYRIDGPSPDSSHHHQQRLQQLQQQHGHRGASRRYGDLSAIEERSERSDRSMQQYSHHDWNRSSQRRPAPNQSYGGGYSSGDSEDEDDYVQRLVQKVQQLKEDKSRYRNHLDNKKSELEYTQYRLRDTEEQLKLALDRNNEMEQKMKAIYKSMRNTEQQLKEERRQTELLSLRLSEMTTMTTSATSDGAKERLASSSETSLEMDADEEEGETQGGDEVRNFRASDSVVTAAGSMAAAEEAAAAAAAAAGSEADEMELPRGELTPSPHFELRRTFSDMGPESMVDGAGEEMAEGGSWRRRERRRSFVKRSLLPPSQESESSDGERVLLMERQIRKKGAVVKYDPNRRVAVKEKHFRRFKKPEQSALDRFTFLEQEVTDISGMLSSPNEGNY